MPFDQRGLSWLLSPLTLDSFRETYYAKKSLLLRRDEPSYYDELLQQEALDFTILTALRFGDAVDILAEDDRSRICRSQQQAVEALRSGKSIRVNAIQRFSFPLECLSRDLEQLISSPININMYMTPAQGTKALKRHYDTHDVFVLQVSGSKRWRLYGPSRAMPLEFLPLQRHESLQDMKKLRLNNNMDDRDTCELVEEATLRPGDLLYLPRGVWHEAESEPGPASAHLTVGIEPLTFFNLLHLYVARLSMRSESLRVALPLGFGYDSQAFDEVVERLAELLPTHVDEESAREAVSDLMSSLSKARRSASIQNELVKDANADKVPISPETVLLMRPGVVGVINAAVTPHQLVCGSQTFSIDLPYVDACRFIVRERQFKAGYIPGAPAWEQTLRLLDQLLDEGILTRVGKEYESKDGFKTPTDYLFQEGQWLPISLSLGRNRVSWLDFGNDLFIEPFFEQTVRRLTSVTKRRIKQTRLQGLVEARTSQAPSGFIFHMSRCGSTLVANALKGLPGNLVISEPSTVNQLLQNMNNALLEGSANYLDLLKALLGAFEPGSFGEHRVIFKFSSWNLFHLDAVRELWPQVPCVVMIRDPLEVAVSCLEQAPGWMKQFIATQGRKAGPLGFLGQSHSEMNKEEYVASMLGEFLVSAARARELGCRLIDYAELVPEVVAEIAATFGSHADADVLQSIASTFEVYSKGAIKRPFQSDNIEKRQKASQVLIDAVSKFALPAYLKLKEDSALQERVDIEDSLAITGPGAMLPSE
jgi:ribosomal protein L16 Arg81 hydroxylase